MLILLLAREDLDPMFFDTDPLIVQEDVQPDVPPRECTGRKLVSCFVPGTLITMTDGQKPVERLAENDLILTRADTNEWGIASDEYVAISVTSPMIHGLSG